MSFRKQALILLDQLDRERIINHLESRLYNYEPVKDLPLVIKSLGRLGGAAKTPLLLEVLRSTTSSYESRLAVITALAEAKPVQINDQLIDILHALDPELKGDMALALSEIGSASSLPHIAELLDNSSDDVKLKAISALAKFGNAAHAYIPVLESLYHDADLVTHNAIESAIQSMDDKHNETYFMEGVEETISLVGRDKEIKETINVLNEARVIYVAGMPGIGKTVFSKKIGQHFIKQKKRFIYVDLHKSHSSTFQILQSKLSLVLGLKSNASFSRIVANLALSDTLICFDNIPTLSSAESDKELETTQSFISSLIAESRNSKFLLTAQIKFNIQIDAHIIQLNELPIDVVSELLRESNLNNITQTASNLSDIYRAIGGNPSLLQQFARWTREQKWHNKGSRNIQANSSLFREFFQEAQVSEYLHQNFFENLSNDALQILQVISMFRVPFNIEDYEVGALLESEGVASWEDAMRELREKHIIYSTKGRLRNHQITPMIRWFIFYQQDIEIKNRIHKKLASYFKRISSFFEAVYHLDQAGNSQQAVHVAIENTDRIASAGGFEALIQWFRNLNISRLDAIESLHIDRHLALLLRLQGDYDQAVIRYHSSLDTYQKNNDRTNIAQVKVELAELLLEQGLALEADTQALQAQQLLSGLRLPDLTIRVEAVLLQIHLLRGVYVDTGQLEQWEYLADGITSLTRIQVLRAQIMADIISEQSTKVLDRISSLESLMENLPLVHYLPLQLFLAEALVACGEFQKADVLARSVLPLATKLSLIGYQGNISRILGQIQLFVGTLDRAQDLIEQSIQMLVRIRSPRQLAKSHLALARTLERTGFAKDSASVKTQISKVQQCMATGNFKLLVL